jgi:uncharacterized membrane protein YedE/YeeE
MHHFSPFSAVIGGAMIGLAAALFLLAHGRSCGISGLFGGLLRRSAAARDVRVAFVGGLFGGGLLLNQFYPSAFERAESPPLLLAISAGLLVGFGTQLGNGCTSGHGICGISRLSLRSFVATGTFLSTGIATRFVVHHVFGGW